MSKIDQNVEAVVGFSALAREMQTMQEKTSNGAETLCVNEKHIREVFGLLAELLASGRSVRVPQYFALELADRAGRDGVNPATQEKIHIPARRTVSFKLSSTLKKRINP